ncbi:Clr5 domain [Penicillium digitatum]|nr:Clr5 domain [Penicillium digitatum]
MENHYSTPISPQSPNVFRPRRSDDWHEYREIIEQLYRNDQLKLRDVKRIMERDYKFFASEKQYKDRLAAWHVRKNIKAKEVHIMLRKQQKRAAQGKQTAFRVNGQNVDPKRIARFVRRYGTSWDTNRSKESENEPQSPEPQTPSDMTCYTPEPTDEHGVTTPISPLPDMQSPIREMPPYPLGPYDPTHLESLPDLELEESPVMPLSMHSNQPRHIPSYHHSIGNHLSHGAHGSHIAHISHLSHGVHSSHGSHGVHHAHVSHSVHGHPGPAPRDLDDAPSEADIHPPDWNTVESFQTRLQDLDFTLTQSMSKWARDQDPNHEPPHHEGLGM